MTRAAGGPPVALTIGGSDSGGCYGVQTDLRTFAALGVHGTCALTVITAQNTQGVTAAQPLPVALVEAQLLAVLADFTVAAVKTGMLGRVEVIEAVARLAADGRLPNLVVDPVIVNRHGVSIFGKEITAAYRELLIPHAALLTPNSREATLFGVETASDPSDPADRWAAARAFGVAVVITAGREDGPEACDLFWDGDSGHELRAARLPTRNNAGSGDAFSAAVTAGLAHGSTLVDAVQGAKAFVHRALAGAASWQLGAGPGPLDCSGAMRD